MSSIGAGIGTELKENDEDRTGVCVCVCVPVNWEHHIRHNVSVCGGGDGVCLCSVVDGAFSSALAQYGGFLAM